MTENQKEITVIMLAFIFILVMFTFIAGCAVADEFIPDIDMNAIKTIESSGNPHAYNKESGATGLYQITPICLEDYVNFYCHGKYDELDLAYQCQTNINYQIEDMYDPIKNISVAYWYMKTRIPQLLKHFGHEDTLENRLIAYNCGISCVGKKLPKETRNYLKKYRRIAK